MTFLVGGLLTALAHYFFETTRETHNRLRLDVLTDDITDSVYHSLNVFTYGLGGANGIFAASESVAHDEFKAYVESRNLPVEFPGALGFGFIQYVRREVLPEFLDVVRNDNQSNFELKTKGEHSDLFVIRYIEPEEENRPSLGYDIGSEAVRRATAERAMLTGKPTITPRLHLIQDTKNESGFLYLRPVYKRGQSIATPDARRAAILGWVYAPVTLERVMKAAERRFGGVASIRIFETAPDGQNRLIYASPGFIIEANDFRGASQVRVGQSKWVLFVDPKPTFFELDFSTYIPGAVWVVGFIFATLLSTLTWFYLKSRERIVSDRLKRGEDFVQGILDSANFSIIVTDTEGTIKVFNRGATELLGYSAAEVVGKASPEIIHDPSEIARHAEKMSRELNQTITPGFEAFIAKPRLGLADENEWSYIRKDGSRFPVRLSATAIRDEGGAISAYVGIAQDITTQKQIEDERKNTKELLAKLYDDLQMKERLLRQFVNDSPAAVAMFDRNLCYLVASGRWLKDYGLEGQDIIGKSHYAVFPTLPERFKENHRQILSGEVNVLAGEDCYTFDGGEPMWIKWELQPWRGGANEIAGLIIFSEVVTARKLAEKQLLESHEQVLAAKEKLDDIVRQLAETNTRLEQATSFKSQFLANMSHEIRTPLTSIIGYSESLLANELNQEERSEALQTVLRNGNHLLGVINDILDFSKIEAGKLDIDKCQVSVADLISDVKNLMRQKALEKALSLGFEYTSPVPTTIHTDPTRIKQILVNLIGNAVKFTKVGGVKINVSFDGDAERISFAVIDTGPGMTEPQMDKVFQPFAQADASVTRAFGGTGLGLVISSQLAEQLGGEIKATSEFGKGSVFTVSIATGRVPESAMLLASPPTSRQTALPVTSDVPQLGGKILIAEDGEDNRKLLSLLLRKTGADFRMVENGALAVQAATESHFDLILMDIQMPVMDGYTAMQKLREHGVKTPILALTANALKSDIEHAYAAGCTDFLGKPFTRSSLYAKLSSLLTTGAKTETPQPPPFLLGEATLSLLQEDPEFLNLILSALRNFPKRFEELLTAFSNRDWNSLERKSHSLCGASGNLGFLDVSNLARALELAASKAQEAEVSDLLDRLKAAITNSQTAEDSLREAARHSTD